MDFTGLEEDAVATALFDAQWDEQRAIELLLEEAEQLTAWEETGPKKKKNKNKLAADETAKVMVNPRLLKYFIDLGSIYSFSGKSPPDSFLSSSLDGA